MSLSLIDLPTEVIAHIFSFISHKKDRRNLALLCKKSHEIVRQQSKKHNHLDLTDKKSLSRLSLFDKYDEFPFQKLNLYGSQIIGRYNGFWQRHGVEITQMTLKCYNLDRFGSKLKELFPNLTSLINQSDLDPRTISLNDGKEFFSEKIYYLQLNCYSGEILDSTLELFPGLKSLKLDIYITYRQKNSEAKDLMALLDKWLLKLENITLSIRTFESLHLLDAFDGWINEKLSFDNIEVPLKSQNIETLKKFFSVTRHIKTLKIDYVDIVLDPNLCTLIDQNATIDRLIIRSCQMTKLDELINNTRGVKEIIINGGALDCDLDRFSPEALLNVKKVELQGNSHESCESASARMPWFRNLQILTLSLFAIGNQELELVVNRFPLLEDLRISNIHATNGHAMANLTRLQSLEITYSPMLTDAFFDFGSQLPKMKSLSVSYAPYLTLAGVKSIVANCPKIETIKFQKCAQINEECIDIVAQNLFYIENIKVDWMDPSLKSVHNQRLSLKRKYSEFNG